MGRHSKAKGGLNERQARFIKEYLIDTNGKQAAIRCGYAAKGAEVTASKLLINPKVAQALAAAQANLEKRMDINAEKIMQELAIIGFSDIQNYLKIDPDTGAVSAKGFDEMPPGASRAIESIKEDRVIKESADGKSVTVYDKFYFKLHPKTAALELMMRKLGMLIQKLDLSGKVDSGLSYEEALNIFKAISSGEAPALAPGSVPGVKDAKG
jgi:phage terminase small subunit